MRGLSAGSQASQGSGSTGLWPNVAIYLDNQSGQLPNRNLDIYAADLNRIEVLEGPQGTLFGAGAEAGVIRYITNEPKLDVTEGNVKAGYGATAHGDPNTDVTAVLEPSADRRHDGRARGDLQRLARRLHRQRAGDLHAQEHRHRHPLRELSGGERTMPGRAAQWRLLRAARQPGHQQQQHRRASASIPVTYQGIRVEALYKFNDDWDALITQSYQNMDSQGVFYQQPNASDGAPLQPLEVTLFNGAYDKDKFESTAWTVNGKFGDLKAVYTGGYLVRNVEQVGDYTNYARGVYADYYQCYGPGTGYDNSLTSTCFSPSAIWHSAERNTHQQHEFRLSTPDEWRVRGIAGVFWEDNKLYDQTGWNYKTVPSCTSNGPAGTPGNTGCFSDIGTSPGTTVRESRGARPINTSFYQDTVRETKQTAFFASVDFDLIPKVLTITAGTRHFQFDNSIGGQRHRQFRLLRAGRAGRRLSRRIHFNLNAQNLRDTESGFKSRGNLTWHITPDRHGVLHLLAGLPSGRLQPERRYRARATARDGVLQYLVPSSYSVRQVDEQRNRLEDGIPRIIACSGTAPSTRRTGTTSRSRSSIPGLVGNIFYNTNGQNFRIRGIETSLVARVIERTDAARCGLLEPERADEFAVS